MNSRWVKKLDKFIATQKVRQGFLLSREQAMDLLVSFFKNQQNEPGPSDENE